VSRSKKRFSEYSPAQRLTITGAGVVSVALVVAAERDLQHRPPEAVRGPKLLWRLVCLNALGAVGYLRWGRLPAAARP